MTGGEGEPRPSPSEGSASTIVTDGEVKYEPFAEGSDDCPMSDRAREDCPVDWDSMDPHQTTLGELAPPSEGSARATDGNHCSVCRKYVGGLGGDCADHEDRVEAADSALVRLFDHPITANEIHAIITGMTAGWLTLFGLTLGYGHMVLYGAGFLVGYAFFGEPMFRSLSHDAEEYPETVALKTIRYEPWWFLSAFTVTLGLAGGVM